MPASRAADRTALILPRTHARRLLTHARRALPHEACALLSGFPASDRVAAVHLARNRLVSPYRYDVHPEDLVRIVHRIEARGEELMAIFHSHPAGPAVPSAADVREARYRVVQLVADSSTGELRAWRIDGSDVAEVPLVIADVAA